ncbi:MAG TPA: KamA family radical SAM protein [Phycisphaerae bacterium]|nr:KamA family radical SAM protein [Phycisphaerae bacterium]HNU43743.1 KamA family radical SAM protein [Phycisphaerae bacterium]
MFEGPEAHARRHVTQSRHGRYYSKVSDLVALTVAERARLDAVAARYRFRANAYYLSLIDWNDPHDPIRRIVIPSEEELSDWGSLDPSNEQAVTVARGVQHKYADTVLLLCNEVCGAYCRYCFRKRLFASENDEASNDISAGLDYIADHPEVTNVLLTGGDPLLMSTRRLVRILRALRTIEHVQIIRIGSKMPAFAPWRILDDAELQSALRLYSTSRKRVYLMTHFDHPRELTDLAIEGLDCFIRNGVICTNQCPLIRGVNDDARVLAELFRKLSFVGCPPYYLFQCRPTLGNEPYTVPIVRGWQLFKEAMHLGSGLAWRARFVMSHATGKLEIVTVDDDQIHLQYHRARDPELRGQTLCYRRDDRACWLDELEPVAGLGAPRFPPHLPVELQDGPA